MSMLKPLFRDRISKIYSVSKDGYGTITRSIIYENVPCDHEDKITLKYNEILANSDCVATFIVPKRYALISIEDIIVYDNYEYIVKNMQDIKPLIGPVQAMQIRVSRNGD